MHTSIQNNVRDWLVPFGMGRGGRPSQNWPSWDQSSHFRIRPRQISDLIENSTMQNISAAISNFGPERWKLFIICLFRA